MKAGIPYVAISILLLLNCLFASSLYTRAEEIVSDAASVIRLSRIEGTVEVSESAGKEIKATDNMRLFTGNHITTASRSFAYFKLDESKAVKLDSVSEAEIRKNGKKLEVLLASGGLYFDVSKPLAEDETLNIKTSNMIMGIRGTNADVTIVDHSHVVINLYTGRLVCTVTNTRTNETTTLELEPGQSGTFAVAETGITGEIDETGEEDKSDEGDDKAGLSVSAEVGDIDLDDVKGYVLMAIIEAGRSEEIKEASGIDVGSIPLEEIEQRIQEDEAVKEELIARVEEEERIQEQNVSKDNVWEINPDTEDTENNSEDVPERESESGRGTGTGSVGTATSASNVQIPAGIGVPTGIGGNGGNAGNTDNGNGGGAGGGDNSGNEQPSDNTDSGGNDNNDDNNNNDNNDDKNDDDKKEDDKTEKTYKITVATAENGSVSVDKSSATKGATVNITATPAEGYEVDSVSVTGVSVSGSGSSYSFTMPAKDVTVTVTFRAIQEQTYSISVSSGRGGSAAASAGSAKKGERITITCSPNDGYETESVTATSSDGSVSVSGSKNSYSFTMPAGDVTVSVSFSKKPETTYSISVSAGTGGSATASASSASQGTNVTISCVPAEGYEVDSVTASGPSGSVSVSGSGNSYSFTMPAGNVSVSVTFKLLPATTYSITIGSLEHGSISLGTTSAAEGDTVSFTLAPDSGYKVDTVSVTDADGSAVAVSGSDNSRSFTMPGKNVTVSATFVLEVVTHTITYQFNHDGVATVSGPDSATQGASVEVTVTINVGANYVFKKAEIMAEGESTKTRNTSTFTFVMPDKDVTVSITLEENQAHTVTLATDGMQFSDNTGPTKQYAKDETVEVYGQLQKNDGAGLTLLTDIKYSGSTTPETSLALRLAYHGDQNHVSTWFTMPDEDVTVIAEYLTGLYKCPRQQMELNDNGSSIGRVRIQYSDYASYPFEIEGYNYAQSGRTMYISISGLDSSKFDSLKSSNTAITISCQGGSSVTVTIPDDNSGPPISFMMPSDDIQSITIKLTEKDGTTIHTMTVTTP